MIDKSSHNQRTFAALLSKCRDMGQHRHGWPDPRQGANVRGGSRWLAIVALVVAYLVISPNSGPLAGSARGQSPKQAELKASVQPTGLALHALRLGLAGRYKLGQWTPIAVEVSGAALSDVLTLRVTHTDADGVPACFVSEHSAKSDASQWLTALIKTGESPRQIAVEIIASSGGRAQRIFSRDNWLPPVPTSQQLVISMGPAADLETALALRAGSRSERIAHQAIEHSWELPGHWLGYSCVDAIVLTTSDVTMLTSLRDDQIQALRQWVELGGAIVWSAAEHAGELLGADGILNWLAPGDYEATISQRQTTGIEQFTGTATGLSRRLDVQQSTGSSFSLPMTVIAKPRGVVVASEGLGNNRHPAIIASTVGLGRAIFVAFDLDQPPFTNWPDRPRLVGKLLDLELGEPVEEEGMRLDIGPLSHLGFTDIAGQLRHALDHFRGVPVVPFSVVAALISGYLVIIGPLDYWLVRRLRRPELTWLTFTSTVIAFTSLAAWLCLDWKGRTQHVNQVTLVDIDANTGRLRGTAWAHLFSPRTSQATLEIQPRITVASADVTQHVTSWQGLPGDGFGGLDRTDRFESFDQPYLISFSTDASRLPTGMIERFPLSAWSSRSLVGQWWGTVKLGSTTSRLEANEDSIVTGTLTNPLPCDLEEAVLVFDRWAYRIGTFARGDILPMDQQREIDLQTLLTQRKVIKGTNVLTPWDQSSTDINRIMQLVLFYDAGKGRAYTQLQHRFLKSLDWSRHLATDQAVLWGRSRLPAAELRVNQQTVERQESWNYYRLLIPVTRRTE